MKKLVAAVICILLVAGLVFVSPVVFAEEINVIDINAAISDGSVTLNWEKQTASTIYVYRDYYKNAKPVATLNPTDTSFTESPTPGSHTYSVMVIGRDGRVACRSSVLPTYIPPECEYPDNTMIKLWIGKKTMGVNCDTQEIDSEPIIIQSNTFVSIRPIIEAVGGSLGWDGATKSVIVNLPPHSVSLSIGKNTATVDGKEVQINSNPEIVPVIVNGRTMLPFRFIAENLEGTVEWIGSEKRIDILFPLQEKVSVRRAMSGMTSLGRNSLGQIVSLKNIEELETDNPIDEFLKGAKVLTGTNSIEAVPILEYKDIIGRPNSLTKLSDWFGMYNQNLKAYKISYKSNLSSLNDFDSVILLTSDGEIVDATFITAGFDFNIESSDTEKMNYQILLPRASVKNKKYTWNIESIPMTASSKVTSLNLDEPPGCDTCSRTVGNANLSFENKATENLSQANNMSLVLLSSLVDFSFDISGGEGLTLSLDEGCGFFPGTSCPSIDGEFAEFQLSMVDNRPPNNTSTVNNCSEAVKGTFNIAESNSKWNRASDGKSTNEDFLSLNIEDSSRPRSISLDIKENDHMFGFFKVFALPKNISLSPNPMLDITVPILNSPSGKQVGRFRVSGTSQLKISFPNGKPSCWFGDEDKDGQTNLSINTTAIDKSTDFDCPCGETNVFDYVNYEIIQEEGVGSVIFDVRVNSDIAFVPKNAEVSIELIRNDEVVSTHDLSYSDPSLNITDDTAEAGEFYKYCLKLISNNVEIENYCIEEELQPNPWLFFMEWSDVPNGRVLEKSIERGSEESFDVIIHNVSENTFKAELSINNPNYKWDVSFVDKESPTWIELKPGQKETVTLTIYPDSSIPSGEKNDIEVVLKSGLQTMVLTGIFSVSAPSCSYEISWVSGGTGMGNDISPGTELIEIFTIKNTSSQQQQFILDYSTEQDNTNTFWNIGFKDQRKGGKIFLGSDEETQVAFAVSSPQGAKDGETLKIKIEVLGCGESKELSWSITNKLMECSFELEWAEKKSTTRTTVETDSRWNETFYVWNFSDYEGVFTLDVEVEGEPIVAYLDNYDLKIKSGTYEEVTITFQIHAKAKVGDSSVNIVATCGKTTQTLDRRFLIKKKSDCQFECYFLESETSNLGKDMEVGKEVQIPIYVKNNSVDPQLFSVKVVRSETDWASGLVEGKVRQTFNLGSGGDTSNLVVWIRGEDDTKPGDTCKLSIVITACNTKKTIVCNITCVEKTELDVELEQEITFRNWKKNGMLEVGNRIEFNRKGSGNILTQNYKIKFFDAQQDNAYIGELDEVRLVMSIYKGRPQWDFKYYVSTEIIEKLKSFDSKKIKAKMTISMLYTHDDGTTDVVKKELETIFELP